MHGLATASANVQVVSRRRWKLPGERFPGKVILLNPAARSSNANQLIFLSLIRTDGDQRATKWHEQAPWPFPTA